MEIDTYRDGGTVSISEDDITLYCIDKRIGSENKDAVFACYPTDGLPISGAGELERAKRILTEAVPNFGSPNHLIAIAKGLTWINQQIYKIKDEEEQ